MPGAFLTQTDLVNQTLGNLNALEPGQTPDVEDVEYVGRMVDPTIRMLSGLDICYIADANNIPGALFTPLADILAGECAGRFTAGPDDFTRLVAKGLGMPPGSGAGAMALKQISRGRPTFEPLRVQYF